VSTNAQYGPFIISTIAKTVSETGTERIVAKGGWASKHGISVWPEQYQALGALLNYDLHQLAAGLVWDVSGYKVRLIPKPPEPDRTYPDRVERFEGTAT
jgi:hypothetical protein